MPFLNIHRIKFKQLCDTLDEAKTTAKKHIEDITDIINRNTRKSNSYELIPEGARELGEVNFVVYRQRQDIKEDPYLDVFGVTEHIGGANTHIIFCIFHTKQTPSGFLSSIYALTSKNAWQVIRLHSDLEFSLDLANKILNSDGARCLVERTPVGNARGQETSTRVPVSLNSLEKLVLVNTFGSDLKETLEIRSGKQIFLIPQNTWADIGPGRIKIRYRFNLWNLSLFLPHLENLYKNTTTECKVFTSRMHKVDADQSLVLDDKLAKAIIGYVCYRHDEYNWIRNLNVCHSFFRDFTKSVKTLYLGRDCSYSLENTLVMADILDYVRPFVMENNARLESWKSCVKKIKKLKSIKIGFNSDGEHKKFPILDFLEGHTYMDSSYFCRMGKSWHYICEDFIFEVEKKFRQVIKDHLVMPRDQFYLPKHWPIVDKVDKNRNTSEVLVDEAIYNNLYHGEPGFFVGDKNTPLGIELFDILENIENKESALYHVKMEFNQTTRDLCSQIRNAANNLQDAKINKLSNLDIFRNIKLPEYAASLKVNVEKLEILFGCTDPRNITFVMATQTHKKLTDYSCATPNLYFGSKKKCEETRSLTREGDKTFTFLKSNLEEGLKTLESNERLKFFGRLEITDFQGLDALLHLLEFNKFCYQQSDGSYHVTSKLIYVENSDIFGSCVKMSLARKPRKDACDQIRFLLSPWITDFKSLLPKYCVIELSDYFKSKWALGEKSLKICEIFSTKVETNTKDQKQAQKRKPMEPKQGPSKLLKKSSNPKS